MMSLPAFYRLRQLAPHAQIDLVTGSWNEPLARLVAGIDRVESLDARWLSRGAGGLGFAALIRRAWAWRRRRYDVAINLEGDIRSHLLLAVSGAAWTAGFDMAGGGPALDDAVGFDPADHTAQNGVRLVASALGDATTPGGARKGTAREAASALPRAALLLPADARARAERLLSASTRDHGHDGLLANVASNARSARSPEGTNTSRYLCIEGLRPGVSPTSIAIGIQVGAGRLVKQWPAERFAELAGRLGSAVHTTIVLTGAPEDRPIADVLLANLPPATRVIDLVGTQDLVTLAAVLERLSVLVTPDTGPMHLAAAVGTPVVALFGPASPERWGPLSQHCRIVRVDLPCSPCNRIRRPPSRCVGHTPDCMAAIEVDDVYRAVTSLLESVPATGARPS